MPKIVLPKWKSHRRAFEVLALRHFSNFHTLRRYIYIGEKMPLPEDIGLKPLEEIVEVCEIRAEVIVK